MSKAPTAKQSAYFAALVKKVAEREGTSERDVHQSLGLIEPNQWGGRVRSEAITSAAMSAWISILKGRLS